MNYTFDEIMARLQKGESIEAIGNEFAEILNKADTAHKAKIQENEKAKVEKAKRNERVKILADMISSFRGYLDYVDDVDSDELLPMLSVDDLEELDRQIISMLELAKSLIDLERLSFPKVKVDLRTARPENSTAEPSADEVLKRFLASLG